MRKNAKLTLGFLAVLAAPFAINATGVQDVQAATGWVASGNTWYYYNNQGQQVRNSWIGNYYLGADGRMVTNAWIGQYYVGANGAWEQSMLRGWIKEGQTWYYYNNQGQLVKNAWAGNYWLGADGKMVTNAWVDNDKYYVDANGAWVPNAKKQVTDGWVKEGNTWYFYKNGQQVKNAWAGNYWLGADGKMVTNAWVDNDKYYVDANGAWVPNAKKQVTDGWIKEGTTWYFYKNGQQVKNAWAGNYHLGADGKMVTNTWVGQYYVDANGAWVRDMHRGWVASGNTWYYYNNEGQLVKNAWAGNYYLGADGKMVTNAWVDNNRYYVDANGAWVKDAKKNEQQAGWVNVAGTWYYFKDGVEVKNAWVGNYYLGADGKMATNAWVDNGRYYVGNDGAWVQNPVANNDNSKRIIFLDPGHGGSDSGAAANGVREKDVTLSVYKKVSSKLAQKGYTVISSRDSDQAVGLIDRAVKATNASADMLLSIHFNAGGGGRATGIETYYYQAASNIPSAVNKENHNNADRIEKSRKLAQKVQQNLLYQTGAQDRGVKRQSFAVLRETAVPAILVELGFLDNSSDAAKIKTDAYQEKLADGIVNGIEAYYR